MRLYVGNIARDVTEEDLRSAFQGFGQVEQVQIMKDKFNSAPKGFAFVEMPSREEAEKAIAGLKGTPLKGRSLDITEAFAKPRRGGPRRSR